MKNKPTSLTLSNFSQRLAHAKTFKLHDLALCLRSNFHTTRGHIVEVVGKDGSAMLKVETLSGLMAIVDSGDFLRLRPGLKLPLEGV